MGTVAELKTQALEITATSAPDTDAPAGDYGLPGRAGSAWMTVWLPPPAPMP